jgi:hypothetical protein
MQKKLILIRNSVRLTCVWVSTGDVKKPLACVWVKTQMAQTNSSGCNLDESGRAHLCA